MSKRLARVSAVSVLAVLGLTAVLVVAGDRGSDAQTPEPASETLLAAKLDAFASGDVFAGPGHTVVPAGYEKGLGGILWGNDNNSLVAGRDAPSRHVTLSVQALGECDIRFFLISEGSSRSGIRQYNFTVRGFPEAVAWSGRSIRRVGWAVDESPAADCPFLWVLRSP